MQVEENNDRRKIKEAFPGHVASRLQHVAISAPRQLSLELSPMDEDVSRVSFHGKPRRFTLFIVTRLTSYIDIYRKKKKSRER